MRQTQKGDTEFDMSVSVLSFTGESCIDASICCQWETRTETAATCSQESFCGRTQALFCHWKPEAGRRPLSDTCCIVQSNYTTCCLQSLLMYDFICCHLADSSQELPCIAFTLSRSNFHPVQCKDVLSMTALEVLRADLSWDAALAGQQQAK